MPFDAILFDFDGVLADSEPIHYEVWCEILAPYGFQMDWDHYVRHCVGISDKLMIERFCEAQTPPLDFEEIYGQYPRKKERFSERMVEVLPFRPATLELLHELTLPMAVVSSSGRNEVEPPLVQAGIRGRFQTLVCGLEAPKLKPEPDPYWMGAALLGAKNPLVVEDSDAGERSGIAAGFQVLRVASPDEVAPRLRAMLALD
jgi:HAD superfamily hydrolase (TIGR01509 family)